MPPRFSCDIDALYADLNRLEAESKLPHVSPEALRSSDEAGKGSFAVNRLHPAVVVVTGIEHDLGFGQFVDIISPDVFYQLVYAIPPTCRR